MCSALVLQTFAVVSACAPLSQRFEGVDYPATEGVSSKLISIENVKFAGAFTVPPAKYGSSSMNYSEGVMEVNGGSMFIVGHDTEDAIAQFQIPRLVASGKISDLNSSGPPVQEFHRVLERTAGGNPQALDQIVGLELVNGSLVVNAIEYYDAPNDNTLSTFVISDANKIGSSAVSRIHSMQGLARASGWLSSVPVEWKHYLRASHISGASSGGPIISRHSVGPSAFAVNLDNQLPSNKAVTIPTLELLGFSLDQPLEGDLYNESGKNKLWTHLSQARYGFIVPGTSTYMTIGKSGGHESGVGYKVVQSDNHLCGGYCSRDVTDNKSYYWLWDMRQMFRVGKGELSPSELRPYESGVWDIPFQTSEVGNYVGGASFDEVEGLLYVSILRANNELGRYDNPPVIAAFRVDR